MVEYRWSVRNGFLKKKGKKKVSLWGGRSFCDGCKRQLTWRENIPVLSFLVLKGKSKCCKTPLPCQYPLVEFLTGGLFLLLFGFAGFEVLFLVLGVLIVGILVFVFLVDFKYQIIPDEATVLLVVLAVLWGLTERDFGLDKLVSAGVIFLFFLFLYLVTKGKGMGFGDVKFVVFMGLFLGKWKLVLAIYVAFVVGAAVGVFLMIFKGYGKKSALAFGPFLILGTLVAWWFFDFFEIWIESFYLLGLN